MKQVKSIGLFFVACIMAFAIGTLTGMEMTLQRQREISKAEEFREINLSSISKKEEDDGGEEKEFASFLDASSLNGILNSDTEVLVEESDLNQDVSTINQRKPQEGYFLAFMDSKVIVLKEDKRTVYMTTDISSQMLPEDLRQEIMQLYYVENEQELFDFLESYSS